MKKFFYLFLGVSLIMGACSKSETPLTKDEIPDDTEIPTDVSFDVKLEGKQTFKVGEFVEFTIEGDAETIDFFSGQSGHLYENRDGRIMPSGIQLNWRLHANTGSVVPSLFPPSFYLMVSTDFDGDYSSFSSVTDASNNWLDVTDRVLFPGASSTYADVGPIDLSDLTVLGKPFYFAFKHVNVLKDVAGTLAVVPWTIRLPTWDSVLGDGREIVGTMTLDENTMGFKVVRDHTVNLTAVSQAEASNVTDRFVITGNINNPGAETWVVSKGFFGVEEILGDADVAISIQSLGNSPLTSYRHAYSTVGEFKAHFVAIVEDENGDKHEEVKEVTFTVEE